MLRPLSYLEWKTLRAVLRKPGSLGSDVRLLFMTRHTQDGTFLTNLVFRGLLAVAPNTKVDPDPLKNRYRLTEIGKHAAEYGEFDWDPKTDRAIEAK